MRKLGTVSCGDDKGTLALMVCECGSNLFMIYFAAGHLHIHCEGCESSFRVTMARGAPTYDVKEPKIG
jgi:hypothetical protein